jgi:hypothetical protein
MKRVHTLALATLACGFGFAAVAQTPLPQQQAPNMPAPDRTIPEKIAPAEPTTTGSTTGETLSDKLERTDGVIRPPAGMDPGITAPAPVPNPGTTPVIPPPGSPGGDPTVIPR